MQEPDIEYVEGYEELEEEEDMEDLGNFALGETGADDDDGKIAFDRTLYVFDSGDTMDVEIYSESFILVGRTCKYVILLEAFLIP